MTETSFFQDLDDLKVRSSPVSRNSKVASLYHVNIRCVRGTVFTTKHIRAIEEKKGTARLIDWSHIALDD